MASRGHSLPPGTPRSSSPLGVLEEGGQMLHRPHRECSFTARTADSAPTHSVVQRLQAGTPTSPSLLLRQRAASTCQTTCPCAFLTRNPAPPPRVASTVPRAALCSRSRLVKCSLIPPPVQRRRSRAALYRRHTRARADPPRCSCSCNSHRRRPRR